MGTRIKGVYRDGHVWAIALLLMAGALLSYPAEGSLLVRDLFEGVWSETLILLRDTLLLSAVGIGGWRYGFRIGLGIWVAAGLILTPHIVIESVLWEEGIPAVPHHVIMGAIGLPILWLVNYGRSATAALRANRNELEATVKELEAFAYTISHDLRGPLHTVRSFAEALAADLERQQRDRATEDIRSIHSGIDRMECLLKNILEYSRAGRAVQPTENVPLGDIVREALQQLSDQLTSAGATVSVSEDFPAVSADRVRMAEALGNLIQNSLDYRDTSRPLTIEIAHRASDSGVVFFVRDNGMGIDPAKREKIFDLFQRGDRKSQGIGAGLAIVKRIIEGHGGRIWAEAEVGKGATICFTLPPPRTRRRRGLADGRGGSRG